MNASATVTLLSCLLFAGSIFPAAAFAQTKDFFTGDDEADQDNAFGTPPSDFSILGAFGANGKDPSLPAPSNSGATGHWADTPKARKEGWGQFEDVTGTEVERMHEKSGDMKMKHELRKPLPNREPFGNRLDELEQSIGELKAPEIDPAAK